MLTNVIENGKVSYLIIKLLSFCIV